MGVVSAFPDPAYQRLCECQAALRALSPSVTPTVRRLFQLTCAIRQGEVEAGMLTSALEQPTITIGVYNLLLAVAAQRQRHHHQTELLANLMGRTASPLLDVAVVLLEGQQDRLNQLQRAILQAGLRGDLPAWSDDDGESVGR